MRTIWITAFLLIGAPALAEEACSYVNAQGERIQFLNDGQNSVTLYRPNEKTLACSWAVTPDQDYGADIICEDGLGGGYFFGAPTVDGDGQGLLLFLEQVRYKRCYEPT